MFNRENPFVNDSMFFLNKNHTFYNQTTWYQGQMAFNWTCFTVGSLLMLLTFYLLAAQTPSSLKSYRKMLLLVTFVDLFVLVNCVGVQFRLRFLPDVMLLTLNGVYTSIFTYRQLCPVMCLYTVTGSIAVSILPVQYFYRYYTLEKDEAPSVFLVLFVFLVAVTPCVLVSPKTSTIYCPSENPNPNGTDYGQLWFEEVPVPPLYVELPSEKSLWFYSNNVLITLYYSVAIVYGIRTVRKLKEKFSTVMYSKSAKSMQRQLTKTMVAQSCLPLLTLVLPQCMHQIAVNLNISSDGFANLTKQSLALVPIFNMLACIIFIKPYRKFCLRFVPCSVRCHCPCNSNVGPGSSTTAASRMASSSTT